MATLLTALVSVNFLLTTVQPAPQVRMGSRLGDLSLADIVQGDDVTVGDGENNLIVVFMATYCPVSRELVAKLNDLEKRSGIRVVGITEEPRNLLEENVAKYELAPTFALAIDDQQQTRRRLLEPLKQRSIPYAFLVDKNGLLLWHGHPGTSAFDRIVKRTLEGDWAATHARRRLTAKALAEQYLQKVAQPNSASSAARVAKQVSRLCNRDPDFLTALAHMILTSEQIKDRDYAFALELAEQAQELVNGEDPLIGEVFAMALWENNKPKRAINQLQKAREEATDPAMQNRFDELLARYERTADQSEPNAPTTAPSSQPASDANDIKDPGLEPEELQEEQGVSELPPLEEEQPKADQPKRERVRRRPGRNRSS